MEAWNPSLDVGQAEMDADHRSLYDHTLRAADGVERGVTEEVVAALEALAAASERHFQSEEALMAESAYEAQKVHRDAHRAFMTDFGKLRAELQARGLSPLFRLWFGARFVDWLRFHIRGQDVHFYQHLRQWQANQAREAEARLIAEAKANQAPTADPAPAPAPPPPPAGPKPG